MTEAAYLAEVYDLCRKAKVSFHHCHDSRFCRGRGFPDLILVGKNGLMFREIKTINDSVKPDQTAILWLLKAAGADAGIWTESELAFGTVAQDIESIA